MAKGFLALFAVLLIGTAGYRIIEGWSFLDSFYMTVITLATVGYGEIHPLSIAGRIFTILLILGGVGTVIYILTGQVQYFAAPNHRRMLCGIGNHSQEKGLISRLSTKSDNLTINQAK